MDTGDLLDLFQVDDEGKKEKSHDKEGGHSMQSILNNLGELWDDQAYENEYNVEKFVQSLQ